jgi:DNA polymerase elongation subunit (family B)
MQTGKIFPYSWHIDDEEEEITSIRIYGIDENNANVCLRVDNFTPYVYIELPDKIRWNAGNAQLVGNKIDELLDRQKPLKKMLMMKKKLYGAHIESNGSTKLFPFLFCSFSARKDIKTLGFKLRSSLNVVGIGMIKLKMHESDADPILQLTCCRQISTAGWIEFHGKAQQEGEKLTICDYEFKVKWKHLFPIISDKVPCPKIMGFDIEVNSSNPSAMPNPNKQGDKVFQISCVISRYGDNQENYEKYLLTLGQPDQNIVGEDVLIYMYDTEADLLIGFTKFIREENPNLIVGYNILGFDIPYMIDRAKFHMCIFDFDKQGFHKYAHAREKTIKWSSSAYKNQEFQFLDAEGRVYVDLLPLVKRDFKFSNYKLKTIAEHFIGETKDPLSVKGIFKCYRIGVTKNKDGEYSKMAQKAMAICGKYCVQDSMLTVMLMDKLQTWTSLTEMAKTCCVPIFTLYTQGQQIKVYSQLYKYCMYENIVVEKDGYQVSEAERYVGAHVFPPVPGQYNQVIPFDFASLYPTTIIAYNIDYHTWVSDESDIPDNKCHIMHWEDHIGCEHDPKVIRKMELSKLIEKEQADIKKLRDKKNKTTDKFRKKELGDEIQILVDALKPYVKERSDLNKSKPKFPMCAKRYYRFLKEPRGVLPTIIQNLLDARAHTRNVDMVKTKKKINELETNGQNNTKEIESLNSLLGVLDKRQLAYKVSANSMYGAMGVRRGYLPFMPGAMCTTYMGRKNIEITADTIVNKFGGELVYGDTDSNYINFPLMEGKSDEELWDYSEFVADELTKLFPPPIKLEFEGCIYNFFFILTKKRYMHRKIEKKRGQLIYSDSIGKKGVLLARRDNSNFVRVVYEGVINYIADKKPKDDVLYWVLEQINKMFSGCNSYTDFVVTKSVGNSVIPKEEDIMIINNEKGVRKAKIGDYTVKMLSSNPVEREEQLKEKGASNYEEYYLLSLPAQVQLAERMQRRGQRVDAGSRLEYLITDPERHTAKQYEKVECAEYYSRHKNAIKIDYFYYLKALANPLDQVLSVAFPGVVDFVLEQYKFRYKVRRNLLNELMELFTPKLKFID